MNAPIRTAVVLGDPAERDTIEAALLGQAGVSVAGFVTAGADSAPELADTAHDALVVVCTDESDDTLGFIERAVAERPERPVIVVFAGTANGFVSRAFDAGAEDFVAATIAAGAVPATLGRDVAFALEKAMARRHGAPVAHVPPPATARGEIITMLGPKGGTGKTLTTCNLAAALAKAGSSVIVVDLDLQFGDVGLAFGLAPDKTIYDLASSGGSLDAQKLDDFLVEHDSGLRALLAPRRPDQAGAIGVDFLRELFATLQEMADFVIVDTPPAFTAEVIVAVDCSTRVCVVAMLDALSLKNTKLALETLDRMSYPPDHIRVVLNRSDSRVGVNSDDVSALLGRGPDVRVPSHRDITRSVNEATPIVLTHGNADARHAFESLAGLYLDRPAQANGTDTPTKRRRLFGRGRKG
jgi:pilus assembly protein CpaE